ncbi:MAG: PA0069 family radical SAM protein [Vitreoscilla sp.]
MPDSPRPAEHPVVFVKGRGAGSNRPSRYVRDEWDEAADFDPATRKTEVTERQAKSLLNRNQSPDLSFDHTINPYQGCEHGCVYCFARPTHAYLQLSPGLDFETRLFAKVNAAEVLRKELARKDFDPGIVALGAATDAYQPIDRHYAIARQILQVLAEFDVAVGITTKSALVTRDLDILAPMAKKGLVRVHMSMPTLDHELSRRLDPRANSPTRRLQAIEELTDAGVPVAVYIAPVIPLVNDHELEAILQACAARGATQALYTLLRLPREVRDLFAEWLRRWYPQQAAQIWHAIQAMHEGKDYDSRFGKRMVGTGELAAQLRQRFDAAAAGLGLTFPGRSLCTWLFRSTRTPPQGSLF